MSSNSSNQVRYKSVKRRCSEDGEPLGKRTRTEETHQESRTSTSNNKSKGNNLAANRLTLLRNNIKKTLQPVLYKKETAIKVNNSNTNQSSRNINSNSNSNVRSVSSVPRKHVQSSHSKNELKYSNVSSSGPKKRSINDRLKKPQQKSLSKDDDDDIIIVIDESPAPVISKRECREQDRKAERLVKSRVDQVNSSRRVTNYSLSLSKSLIIVSEASDSNESTRTLTPIKQRLNRFNESSISSSSSSKTLTPGSEEKKGTCHRSLILDQKTGGTSGGLRIPLKRNIFKRPQITSEKSDRIDTCDITDTLKDADVHKQKLRELESSSIFKRKPTKEGNIFATKLQENFANNNNLNNNELSPTSIFGAKIFQNSTEANRSPSRKLKNDFNVLKQGESKVDNKRPSSLAARLARIKNQGSITSKNASQLIENSKEQICTATIEIQPSLRKIQHSQGPITTAELHQQFNVLPNAPKTTMVDNWMDSTHPPSRPSIQTTDESLLVNFESTPNNSEVMTEAQEDVSMDWDTVPEPDIIKPPKPVPVNDSENRNIICVVADTNIFLHDLAKMKEFLNIKVTGDQKFKVYVPWMVLEELDNIKDKFPQPEKSYALAAQKYINKHLVQEDSKIIGQSVDDACDQMLFPLLLGTDPDNRILSCLLQVNRRFDTVILLTNDNGLQIKARNSKFKAYSTKEILAKLRGGKLVKMKVRLQGLLSQIIIHCCGEAFGDACSKMEFLQDGPWPFEGCLKRFKKYWSSVFRQLLLKQCLKSIDELISFTDRGNIVDSDRIELKKFKDKVKAFLFYLLDIKPFTGSVKKMCDEIDHILTGGDSSIL